MTYGAAYDDPPEFSIRAFLLRKTVALSGLLLLVMTMLAIVSLATWNVNDPSLSHATDEPVRNWLGVPGAIFADLVMQFFGIAVIAFLYPALVMGWNMLRRRKPRSWLVQALCALGGTIVLAGALACLPVIGQWPLPTGLGGVSGDMMLKLPALIFGPELSAGLRAALGVVFAGCALALVYMASGRERPRLEPVFDHDMSDGDPGYDEDDDDAGYLDDDDEGASLLSLTAGYVTHWSLLARAAIRRRLLMRPVPKWAAAHHDGDDSGDDTPFDADGRYEPVFDAGNDNYEPEYEAPPEVHQAPAAAQASNRISAPAARPKPGRRIAREAQPSLLGPDGYELPSLHLLDEPKMRKKDPSLNAAALEQNARLLEGVLEDFGVRGEIINVRPGPVVTLYELEPAPGIKSSRVIGLADDIARSMSAIAARVAVVPGRNAIGIELPNAGRETVYLREILSSKDFEATRARLALSLGKTIGGEAVIADLAKMPHLLVAGTTGSGKSVAINTMILSLLYRLTPEQCRMIMIDPKMLELSVYDGIPHLLTPVVTDPKMAVVALKWTVREMEDRYKKMSKVGVRNIDGYNQRVAQAVKKGEVITRTVQTGFDHESGEALFETEELDLDPMPYIVVIIDEMADLMMVAGKDIEGTVQRLAQMARAAGIHVIMATQRPSVDVITGTIKANFPTRISFQVTSKIDSRTILGEQGAEQLLGMGDMLYMAGGGRIQRVHGPFVSDEEVEEVVAHLKEQGVPEYLESITDEDEAGDSDFESMVNGLDESNDLYDKAVAIVLRDGKASTSYVQRRLSIGYNRAASIIEKMEQEGVISAANHAGKREILVPTDNA
jgi:S-DNA-T family DNA segregation ATPase FtsK/SpoIIIE